MTHKAKLGQNFLSDENVLRKIVEFVHPSPEDRILEIGAGKGALTKHLAPLVGELIAVEIDHELTASLLEIPGITIVQQDILETDFSRYAVSGPIRIVGNLPYYISTPILTKLIREREHLQDMTLMFQEEVAQRITAEHSSSEYSYLSVLAQYFCKVERGFRISKNSFHPRPEIESRVLRFEFQRKARFGFDEYSRFVSMAFSQRRKKLINNLGRNYDAKALRKAFAELNIPENARAENLTPSQFESLIIRLLSVSL